MEIKKIIEITPIQIKKMIEEYLKKEGITVRTVKFSTNGATVYITEPKLKNIKKKKRLKRSYENEKIWDIGASVKICNCLKAVEVEDLYALEDYLKKIISKQGGRDIKETLRTIRSLGEKSILTLINLLKQKNLQIEKDGTISHVS